MMYHRASILLRQILTCIFALICTSLLYANPQATKDNLKQLQSHIKSLQKDLASKEVSKSEAADALRSSERAISENNRILAKLSQRHIEANNSLSRLLDQSRQIQDEIKLHQTSLGTMLYYQYLNGQQDYLRLLLSQQDPNQIARNLYYYGYLKRARLENINALRDQHEQLEILTRQSREKMEEIAQIQADQAKRKLQLEQEKIKREKVLANLSKEITLQQQEISKLKNDEQRLANLIKEINKLLAQKKSERTTSSHAPPHSLHNRTLPDASGSGRTFASLKGQLRLPVRGELVHRFNSPRQEGGVKWRGLFIRSPNGGEVKAIAGGQVVFADWLRGFGNLMILDHGNGYMSLYGYNETIYKRVGDSVQGGDTIAAVGNSGGHRESGLYFELRHQGTPFDPLTWVKIE
ncbi:murein hydrolase activator EnvC family protein [Nitrosomonas nitrosa]|nr:peptidoglycan DD-metalloendopeptidase family protein [Nitrosomonas nitrosa]